MDCEIQIGYGQRIKKEKRASSNYNKQLIDYFYALCTFFEFFFIDFFKKVVI